MKKRVCMLLGDDDLVDYRVVHEAASLVKFGYEVLILMPGTQRSEYLHEEGFWVRRVPVSYESQKGLLHLAFQPNEVSIIDRIQKRQDPSFGPPTPWPNLNQETAPSPTVPETEIESGNQKRGFIQHARRNAFVAFLKATGSWGRFQRNIQFRIDVPFAAELAVLRPDVIHVHDLPMLPLGTQIAQASGAKLVYDAHELYPFQNLMTRDLQRRWREVEEKYLSAPDAIITVNHLLARKMEEIYGIEGVKVVRNAIRHVDLFADPELKETSRKQLLPDVPGNLQELVVLVHVSGLHRGRNHRALIELMELLPHRFHLAVLGDGEERPSLEKYSSQRQVDDRVHFLGMLPREQIGKVIVGADIGLVVQKSTGINAHYCSPNRTTDYLMAGLALAFSSLPYLEEFISIWKCGVTFDPNSVADMAEKILLLGGSEESLRVAKDNARLAGLSYTWECEEEAFRQIYDGLWSAN